jgi:hypothetical protein
MFNPLLQTVRSVYSGDSACSFVIDLSRFHRIQASPGYRAAAGYCHRRLSDFGLETEVISFPARYDAFSWSSRHFQEWECTRATLRLVTSAAEARYALFRYATTPFGDGSDHFIFSDSTVGVPMPMLIQWPDKFYHTSADTIEKVDPRIIHSPHTSQLEV